MVTIVLLGLAMLYSTVIFGQERNALCKYAIGGNYNSSIMSITWRGEDDLMFFIKLNEIVLINVVKSSNIGKDRIDANEVTQYNFDQFLRKHNLSVAQFRGYYEFTFNVFPQAKFNEGLIITDKEEWRFTPDDRKIRWKSPLEEEYTVVHDQKEDKTTWGWVFQKDIYDKTDFVTIHQFWLGVQEGKFVLKDKSHYPHQYYIESDDPNSLDLIHRAFRSKEGKPQLFTELPRGFVYDNQMHLFDDTKGCVTIIPWERPDLYKMFLEQIKNEHIMRKNVPYEKYFSCPDSYEPDPYRPIIFSPNRCKKVPKKPRQNSGESSGSKAYWIWIGGALIVILVVIVLTILVCKLRLKAESNLKADKNRARLEKSSKEGKKSRFAKLSSKASTKSSGNSEKSSKASAKSSGSSKKSKAV